MRYKEFSCDYKYQKDLKKEGFKLEQAFTLSDLPKNFECPESLHGWEMRRAIIKWAKKEGYKYFKVVRANGYWRDLHGDYVYELWTGSKEGVEVIAG